MGARPGEGARPLRGSHPAASRVPISARRRLPVCFFGAVLFLPDLARVGQRALHTRGRTKVSWCLLRFLWEVYCCYRTELGSARPGAVKPTCCPGSRCREEQHLLQAACTQKAPAPQRLSGKGFKDRRGRGCGGVMGSWTIFCLFGGGVTGGGAVVAPVLLPAGLGSGSVWAACRLTSSAWRESRGCRTAQRTWLRR